MRAPTSRVTRPRTTSERRLLPDYRPEVGNTATYPLPWPLNAEPLVVRRRYPGQRPVRRSWLRHTRTRRFLSGNPHLMPFPYDIGSASWLAGSGNPGRTSPAISPVPGTSRCGRRIAAYLGMSRGVRCLPEQVLVVAGSQQGLDLAARVLLHPGDSIWMEEPGYDGARAAFLLGRRRAAPIPVDEDGMDVAYGIRQYPEARLAYVTPSHQFPLGATLGLGRRLALLEWARAQGTWVIEDDYDGEFRYSGRPLAALQGLDAAGRVIYWGTFSKVLFPSLRLGYMVVPGELVGPLVEARTNSDAHSPGLEQAVLADFIAEGHFTRHIRRMRLLYAQRQARFREALQLELPAGLEPLPDPAGMHLVIRLPDGVSDLDVMDRVRAAGVRLNCLSQFSLCCRLDAGASCWGTPPPTIER